MFGNVHIADILLQLLDDGGSVILFLCGLEANSNLGTTTFVCLAQI